MDSGTQEYESSLDQPTRERLKEIGWADVVIGIPSHRNGRTIAEVLRATADGIKLYLPDLRIVLVNADGGSSDNTVRHVQDAVMPANVDKVLMVYEGPMGKGTGVRAIFEATALLEARACLLLEARAAGITPEWIPSLLSPALSGYDLAVPVFQRSAYSAALNDNLIYPFVSMFLNTDLRDPMAGECAISGSLASEYAGFDVWETDVSRFGINIWLAMQALAEGRRLCQVDLGFRGDGSGEPGMPLDARFLHTVGTMFRLVAVHRRLWQREPALRQVPFVGGRCVDCDIACRDCTGSLRTAFLEGFKHYRHDWQGCLTRDTWQRVRELAEQQDAAAFDDALWSRVVAEFGVVYNKGEGDPDKIAEALLPLFYGRAASYVERTAAMTPAEREQAVAQLLECFVGERERFVQLWNAYEPWLESPGSWLV